MPSSIQEAFAKAMQQTKTHIPAEWDNETTNANITEVNTMQTQTAENKRVYFQTTNNVTRTTFDFVKSNPGQTRVQIAKNLELQGFKKSSTTSLLGQMVKQGLLRETAERLYHNQPEYTPLKSSKAHAKTTSTPVPPAPKVETKVKRVASTNTLLSEQFDVQKFVDGMTLKQAKAVYDYLRGVFGN